MSYRGNGQCVRTRENQSFRKWIEEQKDVPASRIAEGLRDRGARFGPGRQHDIASRLLPIDVLELLTGEKLELSRLRFMRPRRNDRGEILGFSLDWEARYTVQGKQDVRFDVYFEPFSGGLLAIHRHPGD